MVNYKDARHIIVDIETLGTEPGCPILEIAAAVLYNKGVEKAFHARIDLDSNIAHGQTKLSKDTLVWWMNKREQLLSLLNNGRPFDVALKEFSQWLTDISWDSGLYFWAKSPQFDYGILEDAFKKLDLRVFWNYRSIRDIRTIDNPLFITHDLKNNHNAVKDVENETIILRKVIWGE